MMMTGSLPPLCVLFLVSLILVIWGGRANASIAAASQTTRTIKVGALLAADSWIGKEALRALQLALQHINTDPTILHGTTLELVVADCNCSALQGAAAAIELFKEDVVAIVGPQTSRASYFTSQMAAVSQIPLVSFSATDPSLSDDQNSFFVRLTHNDRLQMDAVANLIQNYGWREVVALYSKDLGNEGIDALENSLLGTGIKIVLKEGLDLGIDQSGIKTMLGKVKQQGSRVYVVHMSASLSRRLFIEASTLGMVDSGYVWIVSEETASVLNAIIGDDKFVSSVQGVVGLCTHIPESPQLQMLMDQWRQSISSETNSSTLVPVSSFGLYAYDSLWTIARGLTIFLDQNPHITFVSSRRFSESAGGQSDIANIRLLQNGSFLLDCILEANFTGVTGKVKFNGNDLMVLSLKVVNMVGKEVRVVGYWDEHSRFSQNLSLNIVSGIPNSQQNNKTQALQDVIWPGGSTEVPKGWVYPRTGKPLVIGVPNKVGYKQFVNVTHYAAGNKTKVTGYCIDVFEAASRLLPYHIDYVFKPFGNGLVTPYYDKLLRGVETKDFDAAVGDIAITAKRSQSIDFTQPYATSGLVVLVPIKQSASNLAWAFVQPFTLKMWLTTLSSFLFSGAVVWILEHKENTDFQGRPKKQFINVLWFIFSTLFFSSKEEVKSILGRVVVIVWLFVILIINSSYTASLTSNLTAQQLLPTIQNIGGLLTSDVQIGYQTGSFVQNTLMQLGVAESRLHNFSSPDNYYVAMKRGIIGAVVDELPYVQVFLSQYCGFTMAGQEFTKGDWGFAFPKGSQLASDISAAILQLSLNGTFQMAQNEVLVSSSNCAPNSLNTNSNQLDLSTFWGLFLITGITSTVCCFCYYGRMLRRFIQTPHARPADWDSMPILSQIGSFFSFVEKREEPSCHNESIACQTPFGKET